MAKYLKLCTFGKIDYIEKVWRMGEDGNFPHDQAKRDFGYKLMLFNDGLKMEIEAYLNTVK